MTDSFWLAKLLGGIAGAFGSIAFLRPRNQRDALIRFSGSVPVGVVLGPVFLAKVSEYVDLSAMTEFERAMAGAALGSLLIWLLIGFFYAWFHEKYGDKRDG